MWECGGLNAIFFSFFVCVLLLFNYVYNFMGNLTTMNLIAIFTARVFGVNNLFKCYAAFLYFQEWTDYDEKSNTPVSIFEVSHNFVKL